MCKKSVPAAVAQCPRCATDLTLLVDFASHLTGGLERAEQLTRQGELGEAVWAYLEVLEVDPDNATARRQVGQVATAVRQFDRAAPGRRWLERWRRQTRFRHWVRNWSTSHDIKLWLGLVALFLLTTASFFGLGYSWGFQAGQQEPAGEHLTEPIGAQNP